MSISADLCSRYIIFLDIDGVLLPVPKFTFGGGELSAACVHRLSRLIATLGGKEKVTIVLSSTWRVQPGMMARLNAFLQSTAADRIPLVEEGTPNGTVLVTAVTYYADDPSEQRLVRDRVDEIESWLHTHALDHPEGIGGRWFAIDDMKLDVDTRMQSHFMHTTTDVGMTDEDVETACKMLETHPSPEEAYARAVAALNDPALKEEEIEIHKVLQARLATELADTKCALAEAEARVATLTVEKKAWEKESLAQRRALEDARYRLALQDSAKRYPSLAAAIELSATKSGSERRELDAKIKSFVTLLMDRKELQKVARGEARKSKASISEGARQ